VRKHLWKHAARDDGERDLEAKGEVNAWLCGFVWVEPDHECGGEEGGAGFVHASDAPDFSVD
jgi:hypothetical protein